MFQACLTKNCVMTAAISVPSARGVQFKQTPAVMGALFQQTVWSVRVEELASAASGSLKLVLNHPVEHPLLTLLIGQTVVALGQPPGV